MQDTPSPDELLKAVQDQLREVFGPALSAHGEAAMAYQARVAANMLAIARRQLAEAPAADRAELARLRVLLERDADAWPETLEALADQLAALNRALAEALADGRLGLDTPGLSDHLWRVTLDKLAVDQPRYGSFRRALARNAGLPPT
jgi:hypothetical protein